MMSAWAKKCFPLRDRSRGALAEPLVVGLTLGPDRPAGCFEDRAITCLEIDRAANRVAGGLVAMGIAPGDRVAVHLEKSSRVRRDLPGHHLRGAGAIMVPTNVMYTSEEMVHILGDSNAKVVFVERSLLKDRRRAGWAHRSREDRVRRRARSAHGRSTT